MSGAVLVGDIGGTNCRFAFASRSYKGEIELTDPVKMPIKDHASFEDAMSHYLESQNETPVAASFAFAGPKFDDEIRMTNADWIVSESALKERFDLETVSLMNDFAAMALGTRFLPEEGFDIIKPGLFSEAAPQAVLGPGTGLGVSCIIPGNPPRPLATEGGHVAFAPRDNLEIEILRFYRKKMAHISAEYLVCGSGLFRIYQALCALYERPEICQDQVEIIKRSGQNIPDALSRETVKVFCNILGGFAANTALTFGATGGVTIAGGVSRHIAPFIEGSEFVKRFDDRGKGSWFVKDIPVRLLQAHFAPLRGAAAMVLG